MLITQGSAVRFRPGPSPKIGGATHRQTHYKMRALTHPLILSTLPHFFAATYPNPPLYRFAILLSSTFSVLWHLAGEPDGWLKTLDYSMAGVWTLTELWYAYDHPRGVQVDIIQSALWVAYVNLVVDDLAKKGILSYDVGHSLWHVLSAAKAIAVARVLSSHIV